MTGSALVNALDDYSFKLWCSKRVIIFLPCITLATRLRLQAGLDHSLVTLSFLLLTVYSLFIIDTMQLSMDSDAEPVVFWSLLGVVVAFAVELVCHSQKLFEPSYYARPCCSQIWASIARPRFCLSFFWW
jgi:hypothetical protein